MQFFRVILCRFTSGFSLFVSINIAAIFLQAEVSLTKEKFIFMLDFKFHPICTKMLSLDVCDPSLFLFRGITFFLFCFVVFVVVLFSWC